MSEMPIEANLSFPEAVEGLLRGDFSRLEPLFVGNPSQIVQWYQEGRFSTEPAALNEAFTCACFNGHTAVAEFLFSHGVDVGAGFGTGMNAFHWAANRGQVETVKFLLECNAPLEVENMYGGTVLGCTVWSALHEPVPTHLEVIQLLIDAGANLDASGYPTGYAEVDNLLRPAIQAKENQNDFG